MSQRNNMILQLESEVWIEVWIACIHTVLNLLAHQVPLTTVIKYAYCLFIIIIIIIVSYHYIDVYNIAILKRLELSS